MGCLAKSCPDKLKKNEEHEKSLDNTVLFIIINVMIKTDFGVIRKLFKMGDYPVGILAGMCGPRGRDRKAAISGSLGRSPCGIWGPGYGRGQLGRLKCGWPLGQKFCQDLNRNCSITGHVASVQDKGITLMEYTQTYENIDVLATLTESVCKIMTEIRTARNGIVVTSAMHILLVLLVVLGKKSAGETEKLSNDELKNSFGHIKKSVSGYSELRKLLHSTDRFGIYRRFFDHVADDWDEIAERCLLVADPDIRDIIETYGVEDAVNTFSDVSETLGMLDTPEWDEAFEYLAAN